MIKQTFYCPFHNESVDGGQSWPEYLTEIENDIPETSDSPQNGRWYKNEEEANSTAKGLMNVDARFQWGIAKITIELPEPTSYPGSTKL